MQVVEKFTLEGSFVGGRFFRVLQHSQLSLAEIWKISVIPKKSLSSLTDLTPGEEKLKKKTFHFMLCAHNENKSLLLQLEILATEFQTEQIKIIKIIKIITIIK